MLGHWKSTFAAFRPPFTKPKINNCERCKDFSAPKAQLAWADIVEGSHTTCPGCSLLKQVVERHVAVEERADTWVSLVAPTNHSAMYELYSNKFGFLEAYRVGVESSVHQLSRWERAMSREKEGAGLSVIPLATSISGNTDSQISLETARTWLERCDRDHEGCKSSGARTSWPARLLDLSGINVESRIGIVRLVNTASILVTDDASQDDDLRYACLSHCWGKIRLLTTEFANLEEHMAGISIDLLPKSFREAILFTKSLDISFIWIDSLCIIQDSAADWNVESAKMATIYRQGHFTISVARATNAQGGCFSTAANKYVGDQIELSGPDSERFSVWTRKPIKHGSWPLLERGWVFQERILSRRIIYFTEEELVWECTQHRVCECSRASPSAGGIYSLDSTKYAHHVAMTSMTIPHLANQWRDMVVNYTMKNLTFDKDVFPALSGLAKEMQFHRPNSEYHAGLWSDSFVVDMLWRLKSPAYTATVRPSDWRAPSWSWASVRSQVTYETMAGRQLYAGAISKTHAKVLSVTTERTANEHGMIESSSVKIQGYVVPATPYFDLGRMGHPYLQINEERGIGPEWDDGAVDGNFLLDLSPIVYLLKMVTTNRKVNGWDELICLVLQKVVDDEEDTSYQRLGYISRYWPEEDKWFKNVKEKVDITIV